MDEKIERLKAILTEEARAVLGTRRWNVLVRVSPRNADVLEMYVDVIEKREVDGRYPAYTNEVGIWDSEDQMRTAAKAALNSPPEYGGMYEVSCAVAKA